MLIAMHYLHRDRKTDNYVYRRSIPGDLRHVLGRREINKSLGTKDQHLALQRHAVVHREVQKLLNDARKKNSPTAQYNVAAEFLREKGFNPELGLYDPKLHEIEKDLRVDYLEDLHHRDPSNRDEPELVREEDRPKVNLLIHGEDATTVCPTLEEALEKFVVERGRGGDKLQRDKRWRDFHHRSIHLLGTVLKDGVHTQLDKVGREDAIRWRDMMVETFAPETVKKHYVTIKALFSTMFDVLEINQRNPFSKLTIKFDRKTSARDRRDPFNSDQEAAVLALVPKMNREAQLVVRLMLCTGCRVTEACTLMRDDIVLDANIPFVHFRENERNEWGLKGSFARKVPVVELQALELLRQFPDGPTRYARPRGAASCSTAINKLFRNNGLKDTGGNVSLYSARHLIKSRLQGVEAPEYVIDEILGHSDGKAKDSYGNGVPVDVTAKWLKAALGI